MAGPLSAIPASSLKPIIGVDDADEKYRSALDKITSALEAREAGNTQQMLLAITQGLLTPGPTGHFGESLGHAAGNVSKMMQSQEAAGLENAKMRLQLAQAEREQAQKKEGLKILEQLDAGGAGQGGSQITKGDDSGFGVMIGGNEVTPKLIRNMLVRNPEIGKALQAQYELTLKSIQTQQGGAYNIITQKYTPFGGKAMVTRNVPGLGPIDMTEQDAMELDEARRNGDAEKFYGVVKRNTMPIPAPDQVTTTTSPTTESKEASTGAVSATPAVVSAKPPTAPMTKATIEAQAAATKKGAEVTAEEEAKRTQKFINAASDADQRISSTNVITNLMGQEGMNQVVGVLEKPGLLPGLLKAAEEGVSAGRGYGLSLPQVRSIYTNNKIKLAPIEGETKQQYDARVENVISRLQQLSSEFAKITFGFRSLAQGQGSISNLENRIFTSMGPSMEDTYKTILAKTAHARARAEAEKEIANFLSNTGMSIDKFKQTKDYENIIGRYDNRLNKIYGGVVVNGKPVINQEINADSLRQRLGGR